MKYSLVPCLLLLFLIFCKSNYVKIGGKDSNYSIKCLTFFINFIFVCSAFGQNQTSFEKYSQKDFEKNKIFENTYHLWWSKYNWGPIVKDTIPYFVDDIKYRGIVNYGVEFKSKDFKVFSFFESKTMYFLKVDIESCKFRSKDSIITIEGFVSGGWGDKAKSKLNEPKNYIEVFLGEKTDTITPCYYDAPVNKDKVEVKLNNKIIDNDQVLDVFPSFYFKRPTYFRTDSKGKRFFKISAKITAKTILTFGGSGCYSEIFDIGGMVYMPNKNKRKKIRNKEYKESEVIMINNKLVSDIEKEKQEVKVTDYYTYTEKAENHIIRRQYADANKTYLQLEHEYKTLFSQDIHNAIRCAILSRDYENAFFWGKKIAQKGINIKYFNASIFTTLKKNLKWEEFNNSFDSISNHAVSKINFGLKQQLQDLLDEDQSDYGLENRQEPKKLYETSERVTDKLIKLIEKEGFPSEEKIGVYVKNETIVVPFPDYNVLIRHAVMQNPSKLKDLVALLNNSSDSLEYDKKRSPSHRSFVNSCFHVYKGNLYNNKSCGNNELMVRKIKFMFSNPNNFIVDQGDYVITEYNKQNPQEYDKFYEGNFNFIMKLTDDWEFYEK